ncbi:MAG: CoA transferase [Acidimicrobiales bacterium]|jgi:crotonobetainyl-CoA:carnitine CoA-transferase CaiB-like acyl-CoA transferase
MTDTPSGGVAEEVTARAPLSGVRVLDLSRVLAGPYCSALLADLGAEIIKIEMPGRGDDTREIGPFRGSESIYFQILNRRKKSVTLNFKDPDGTRLLLELAAHCDVILENFRPGVTEHLGIDYATVVRANPKIVYASISGYGQSGPMASYPAYDIIVQAASGLMSITGFPDGPPTKVGESIGDLTAGVFAAFAISTALYDAARTGQGAHLDVSMLECLLSLEVTAESVYNATGTAPGRVGNRHPVSTPFGAYEAMDGFVILAAANDELFARVARLIDKPDMVGDPRYATDELRTEHEPEVRAAIEAWTKQRSVADVVRSAQDAGVPTSAISDLAQALASEQLAARGALSHFTHRVAGNVQYVGQPVRFSSQVPTAPVAGPTLGADTDAVLGELLGTSAEELSALHARGAL